MVHSLKMGWMKFRADREQELKEQREKQQSEDFYMLWSANDQSEAMRRIHNHIPAPKEKLPGNAESYNPPKEYLFNEKEKQKWEDLAEEPWRRRTNFIPQCEYCFRTTRTR